MSVPIPFTKMVGTGNDFLIVEAVHGRCGLLKTAWPKLATAMCDRRYGVGADGLLVLEPSKAADCRMRILNPDGSEAEMCGNGARCVASYVKRAYGVGGRGHGRGREGAVTIETQAGVLTARVYGNRVAMRMPTPRSLRLDLRVEAGRQSWRLAYVDTGVPHAVVVVDGLDDVDVEGVGRQIRRHRFFQPRGANVDFIEAHPRRPHRLRIRTYERGVEGETLACGTGVTAAAVVHALGGVNGRKHVDGSSSHQIEVETKSGEVLNVSLTVAGRGRAARVTDVRLEGAVQWVCEGVFLWSRPPHPAVHNDAHDDRRRKES